MIDMEVALRRLNEKIKEKRDKAAKQNENFMSPDRTQELRVSIHIYDSLSGELEKMIEELRNDSE